MTFNFNYLNFTLNRNQYQQCKIEGSVLYKLYVILTVLELVDTLSTSKVNENVGARNDPREFVCIRVIITLMRFATIDTIRSILKTQKIVLLFVKHNNINSILTNSNSDLFSVTFVRQIIDSLKNCYINNTRTEIGVIVKYETR